MARASSRTPTIGAPLPITSFIIEVIRLIVTMQNRSDPSSTSLGRAVRQAQRMQAKIQAVQLMTNI